MEPFSKLKTTFCECWTSINIKINMSMKLKQKWSRRIDYSKKCCFYWVITWKLLFRGGGEVDFWWGEWEHFLTNGGGTPPNPPVGKTLYMYLYIYIYIYIYKVYLICVGLRLYVLYEISCSLLNLECILYFILNFWYFKIKSVSSGRNCEVTTICMKTKILTPWLLKKETWRFFGT